MPNFLLDTQTYSPLLVNHLRICTSSPTHSYAYHSTLHNYTRFDNRPSTQLLSTLWWCHTVVACLTFDLSLISGRGREKLVVFNVSKTVFLYLSLGSDLPCGYPHFSDTIYRRLVTRWHQTKPLPFSLYILAPVHQQDTHSPLNYIPATQVCQYCTRVRGPYKV